MDIRKIIYDKLSADTELIKLLPDNRIYTAVSDDAGTYPVVVLSIIDDVPSLHADDMEIHSDVRFQLYITGSTCYLKFYTSSPFGENTISFPLGNVATEFVKVRLTRNSNGTFSATVNGSAVTITGNSAFSFNVFAPANTVPIGDSTLMLKYLRYFKAA